MTKEELREKFEKETNIKHQEVVNGDIPNGKLMYALWLEDKLTTKQESVTVTDAELSVKEHGDYLLGFYTGDEIKKFYEQTYSDKLQPQEQSKERELIDLWRLAQKYNCDDFVNMVNTPKK